MHTSLPQHTNLALEQEIKIATTREVVLGLCADGEEGKRAGGGMPEERAGHNRGEGRSRPIKKKEVHEIKKRRA